MKEASNCKTSDLCIELPLKKDIELKLYACRQQLNLNIEAHIGLRNKSYELVEMLSLINNQCLDKHVSQLIHICNVD